MTTFTNKQKIEAYKAFQRGLKQTATEIADFPDLSPEAKARILRRSVMNEIFELPEKLHWWRKLIKGGRSWLGKKS